MADALDSLYLRAPQPKPGCYALAKSSRSTALSFRLPGSRPGWFDSSVTHQSFAGLADMDMHSGFHLRASRLHATPSPSVRARQRSRPAHPVTVTKVLRDWQIWICTRLLSETKQVQFLHPAPVVRCKRGFFQWNRIMPSKHGTPVRIRHPLPMWLRRSMGKDSRLRTEQLGFESSRGRHNRIAQAERALTS